MLSTNRTRWTLREVALAQLANFGEMPFVSEFGDAAESYSTFVGKAARLARTFMNLGIGRGATVAIFCAAGMPHLHAWLACGLIGAVEVPINTSLRAAPLQHVLTTTRPTVAVVDSALLSSLLGADAIVGCVQTVILVGETADLPDSMPRDMRMLRYQEIAETGEDTVPDAVVVPSDLGSVMFTSGTTGPAKGVMMPNGQLCLLALQTIEAMQINEEDVFYCAHPLNHIAGKYVGVFATFAVGGRVVLDSRFEAKSWLDRIRDSRATVSIAHGPMIEMIAAQPRGPHDQRHNLRRLMCCPLPKHLGSAFEQRFALQGVEMWGMTEVACPSWTSLEGPRVNGSCGRPLRAWYDLQIVDPDTDEEMPPMRVGEIVVRPRYPWTVMQGYLGMPEETLKAWRNLWFHTGDAGYLDADGNMFFVDRLKERIRRRAENISAYDIEIAALACTSVREAAAVGVPSGFEGDDDIKLCIVPESTGAVDPAELIAFLVKRLPPFMVPRYIEILDSLPRTPTNKIRKRELSLSGVTSKTWDRAAAGVRLRDFYPG